VDAQVLADGPAQFREPLQKSRHTHLRLCVVCGRGHEHTDTAHPRGLLRARRQRPGGSRAAEEGDKLASLHGFASYSITSSARTSTISGTWRPSAFAVFMLSTVSYLVGSCTGRSAGFSPLRIRST